jgi:hypothetical protein
MEQSAGQCGGYRYVPSRRKSLRKTRPQSIKNKKGGARRRVKKTIRHTRKH